MYENTLLGKKVETPSQYTKDILFPIPREKKMPFSAPYGGDTWNAYELSYLNEKGKPQIAIGRFFFPLETNNIIESKSLKLYLQSFSEMRFSSEKEVQELIERDLSEKAEGKVTVQFLKEASFQFFDGECIDNLDIEVTDYQINKSCLAASAQKVEEKLFSHLFKSLCPVTGQPDWASIYISYKGQKIDREGLLRYLVSFRSHQGFHEEVGERIYSDVKEKCQTEDLTVMAAFCRRGGLDINPFRSDVIKHPPYVRLYRQ